MDWFDPQNVVAVVTALLGLIAPVVGAVYQLRTQRGKSIGHRVQMDTAIDRPGVHSPTLALLRIENDGTSSIHQTDYTNRDYGLEVDFTDRVVRDVTVIPGPDADHVLSYLVPPDGQDGMRFNGHKIRLPRVPLNPDHHFKLLVWLSDGPVNSKKIEVRGGIQDGRVIATRSRTIDEKPPMFSRFALGTTALLACCLLLLSAIIVFWRPVPIGCAKGELRVVGSTAFAPTMEKLAQRYMADCAGSHIIVDAGGSNEVDWSAVRAESDSPTIALSDGPKPASVTGVKEDRVAVVAFSLVVNDSVTVTDLTTDQIRGIYRADVTNWRELGGPDLPIRLISRDARSGTRELLRQRLLDGRGEPPFSSRDCENKNSPQDRIVRCELGRTDQVLDTVARVKGAIGYSELRAATGYRGGLHTLNIDGHPPSVQAIGADDYHFTEIEYAYADTEAGADSLTASFLNYMIRAHGQDELKSFGHVPCYTPEGLQRCRP